HGARPQSNHLFERRGCLRRKLEHAVRETKRVVSIGIVLNEADRLEQAAYGLMPPARREMLFTTLMEGSGANPHFTKTFFLRRGIGLFLRLRPVTGARGVGVGADIAGCQGVFHCCISEVACF